MWKPSKGPAAVIAVLTVVVGLFACTNDSTEAEASTTSSPPTATTLVPSVAVADTDVPAGPISFTGYDRSGAALDYERFVAQMTNGAGADRTDDALLDPTTLAVLSTGPVYADDDGNAVLDRPAGPVAISFAWPSAAGYSTVILDLPAPGSHPLNLLVARQALADAARWNAAAPTSGPKYATWKAAYGRAAAALRDAEAKRIIDPRGAAALADRSFDLSVQAALLPRWDRDRTELQAGVTIDTTEVDASIWATVVAQADDREPWARIVFDPERTPADYAEMVAAAHEAGVSLMGQFLDSSAMAEVPLAAFRRRVQDFTAAFELEAWEVGNEINGGWLGADAAAKAEYAATYVKANTSARTMLTLYWGLGEDDARWSTFSWVQDNVSPTLLAAIDDVSLSMWVEQNPMGIAFDRAFATMAAQFPGKQLYVGELGYGNDDLDHLWWWGDPTDLTGTARRAVASTYLATAFDRPWLGGGVYWWYYAEDALPQNALWDLLANA